MASNDFVISTDLIVLGGVAAPLQGLIGNSYALLNEASTDNNPTLIPRRADLTTGIGGQDNEGSASLDLIVGGVKKLGLSPTQANWFLTQMNLNGQFFLNGAADVAQMRVQGHTTQNAAILTVEQSSGVDVFTVDNAGNVDIGATNPAQSGSLRLTNSGSIKMRNAANNGDLNIWSSPQSNEIDFGDAVNPVINVLGALMDTNRIRILVTHSQAFIAANASAASMLTVDTSGQIVTVALGAQTAPTSSVDRLILDAVDIAVNSTVGFSHAFLMVGKSQTAGAVDHDSNWRMFVEPLTTTAFDGQSVFRITTEIDTGGPTTVLTLSDSVVTIGGNLAVSGAGPHSIAGVTFGAVQLLIGSTFTSDGASDIAAGLFHTPAIVGAPGDTSALTGTTLTAGITTQTATESIANIAQLQINEPNITDNLTGSITNAQSLLITGAPTEGVSNWALRILSGDVEIGGDLIAFGAGGGGSRMTYRGCSTFYLGNLDTPDEMFFGSGSTVTVASAVASFAGNVFKFRNSAANEQFMRVRQASTLLATPSGASATAAGAIPAGSFVVGVTTRVVTTVTGPAGYDVGDGVDVDRWGNSIAVASGTTSDLTDATAAAHDSFPAANDVVITSDGVDFTGGSIRITVHYMDLQAPSS